MSKVEAVEAAVTEWAEERDLSAPLVVLLQGDEIAYLHVVLTHWQTFIEEAELTEDVGEVFGRLRKKVEATLVQAGYGGDPRP